MRFLKSAQDQNLHDQLIPLRAEIAFLRGTLMKAGERVPLACMSPSFMHFVHRY